MTPKRTRALREIDPETARGLIANSVSDEVPVESRVHATALQMKKGSFSTYGVCLELDSCGHLTSGLHYVQAIVQSNCTVKIWVAETKDI